MKPEEVSKGFPRDCHDFHCQQQPLKLFQATQFGAQLAAQGIQLPSKIKLLIVLFPLPPFISLAFPLKSYPLSVCLFVTWFLVACAVFELLIPLPSSPSARMTGISHQARKEGFFLRDSVKKVRQDTTSQMCRETDMLQTEVLQV